MMLEKGRDSHNSAFARSKTLCLLPCAYCVVVLAVVTRGVWVWTLGMLITKTLLSKFPLCAALLLPKNADEYDSILFLLEWSVLDVFMFCIIALIVHSLCYAVLDSYSKILAFDILQTLRRQMLHSFLTHSSQNASYQLHDLLNLFGTDLRTINTYYSTLYLNKLLESWNIYFLMASMFLFSWKIALLHVGVMVAVSIITFTFDAKLSSPRQLAIEGRLGQLNKMIIDIVSMRNFVRVQQMTENELSTVYLRYEPIRAMVYKGMALMFASSAMRFALVMAFLPLVCIMAYEIDTDLNDLLSIVVISAMYTTIVNSYMFLFIILGYEQDCQRAEERVRECLFSEKDILKSERETGQEEGSDESLLPHHKENAKTTQTLSALDLAASGSGESALSKFKRSLTRTEGSHPSANELMPRLCHDLQDHLGLENACIGYDGASAVSLVWEGLNLTIKKGECVCLMGESGLGKTTILYALTGLLELQSGNVVCDEERTQCLLPRYQRLIGVVFDESKFFHRTIRENLCYGLDYEPSDADLQVACKMACIDSYVGGLERGLDTDMTLAEKGMSGGQRQRLQLARLMINKNAKIILMDEPTSALDLKTEELVIKNLQSFIQVHT
tara:strand:+ start:121 stop:1965 length:1845 start_codon:yes stop_codon:yes gene_type:complete